MATENRIIYDGLTQYAIVWSVKNLTIDQFENMWSQLMDNNIDCYVDHTDFDDYLFVHSGNKKDFKIYFKSTKMRDQAKIVATLTA